LRGQGAVDLDIRNLDGMQIFRPDQLAPGDLSTDEIPEGFLRDPGLAERLGEVLYRKIGAAGEFAHAAVDVIWRKLHADLCCGKAAQPVLDQVLARGCRQVAGLAEDAQEQLALLDFIGGDRLAIDIDHRGELPRLRHRRKAAKYRKAAKHRQAAKHRLGRDQRKGCDRRAQKPHLQPQ
jgi:hypothetical protein